MSISSIIKMALCTLGAIFFASCQSSVVCSQTTSPSGGLISIGCGDGVKGSGAVSTKSISVGAFKSIVVVNGSYSIDIVYSDTQDIKISTYANIIPSIGFSVQNSVLSIRVISSFSTDKEIKISISANALEKFTSDASVNLAIAKMSGKSFEIGSDGFLDAKLSGAVDNLTINADGSSEINAQNLISKNVKIKVGGTGEVSVHASESLDVSIEGVGEVKYSGNPKISKNIEGVGSLTQL